jgi:hypothetical protein
MIGLTDFVKRHKEFRDWLDEKTHNPAEYITRFEEIFNVRVETELLHEIRDIQDELTMLAAVFSEQITVLEKASENINKSREAVQGKAAEDICKNRKAWFKTHSSAFSIQRQSEKHATHIKRMQEQTAQAYQNVSLVNLGHRSALIHSNPSSRISWISSSNKRTY